MLRCWSLFHMNRPEEAANALRQAELTIERLEEKPASLERDELDVLLEEMMVLRAGVALVHDDIEMLDRLTSKPYREKLVVPFNMAVMYNMLGYSCLVRGDFDHARAALAKSSHYHEQAGSSFGLSYSGIFSGMLNLIQGKLHCAVANFRQSEDVSILDCGERSAGAAVARLMQGLVLYEWNRLDEAEYLLSTNIRLIEECTIAEALVLGYITLARIKTAQLRPEEATQYYSEVRVICERRNLHRLLLLVENDFVRMLINQNKLEAAESVASRLDIDMSENSCEVPDHWEPTVCLRSLIRARILVARGRAAEALRDLGSLRYLTIKAGRIQQSTEILILMALAEFTQNAETAMIKNIVAALSLSPSSGFLRVFIDEGRKVGLMLSKVKDQVKKEIPANAKQSYQSILSVFETSNLKHEHTNTQFGDQHHLVEELSIRELEVLDLIVGGNSNSQIGKQLAIAESTVKWHVKNIFGKLGVKNRTSAALEAQKLHLNTR